MYKYLITALIMATLSLYSFQGVAQNQEDTSKVTESIILKKDGTFPKDLTIHIHGDKITINGKTPEDIDVIRKKSTSQNGIYRSYKNRSYKSLHKGKNPYFSFDSPFYNFFRGNNLPKEDQALLGVITKAGDTSEGAKIIEVEQGTAADSAGLQNGDMIVAINGKDILSAAALSKTIHTFDPGDQISVTFLRNQEKQTIQVTLGRISRNYHPHFLRDRNNNPLQYHLFPKGNNWRDGFPYHQRPRIDRNPNLRMFIQSKGKLGVVVENHENPEGAKVIHVMPHSAAEIAGIQKNDIIQKFGREDIDDITDLKKAIQENKGEKAIKTKIKRADKTMTLSVSLSEEKKRSSL